MEKDIAIIGMACIFPGAPDLKTYWRNIVSKVDAVTDPPEDWGGEEIFDPDSTANDRIYCKRGGYLGDLARFDPLAFGIMPRSLDGGEADHFLALRVAYEALSDAGYLDRPVDRTRIAVILGKGTYVNRGHTNVVQHGLIVDQTLKILKQLHPEYAPEQLREIRKELKASLPPFNAEIVPSLIPNIVTGRIANRLDIMGTNYIVDAACASSLIAVQNGIRELQDGKCDLVLAGGVHASTTPPILMFFTQLNGLSRKGRIRPFDQDADGTLLGEGVGIVILKRLKDAERDGDRIYAVIKGVGISSDGRALGLLAPRMEGEELALRRAYEAADVSPSTVELVEAHGTGTQVGDATEIRTLSRVFGPRDGTLPRCAVGSVKSMISHLIPAAGVAGVIKTALSLYHKVLPPTLNCDRPNPDLELDKTPFYINTETRPWIHGAAGPRRAGVSSFGFGGINAHAVLEEHSGNHGRDAHDLLHRWDTEVFIFRGDSRRELIRKGEDLLDLLGGDRDVELKDLAYTVNSALKEGGDRLSIVAASAKELKDKLAYGLQRLADSGCQRIKDQSGIFFFGEPLGREGSLAFLFPGEGAQYVNMLSDLCFHFPEVRGCFDQADRLFHDNGRDILPSQVLFPPSHLRPEEYEIIAKKLWEMDYAVSTVFPANRALFTLLDRLRIRPDVVAGHSSGEFAALLLASGVIDVKDQDQISRYSLDLVRIHDALGDQVPEARLMTVGVADPALVHSIVAESGGALHAAMDNCPHQVILCGSEEEIQRAFQALQDRGAFCTILPFKRAYHTPLFEPVCGQFSTFFDTLNIVPSSVTLYSCATAQPYPKEPEAVRRLAAEQWARPVRFRETILAMYDAGVRIFVEVGPRGNLTSFVDDILQGRDYLAVPSNVPHRSGIAQIHFLLGLLAAHGVNMNLDCLYARRDPKPLTPEKAGKDAVPASPPGHSVKMDLGLPTLRLTASFDLPPSSLSFDREPAGRVPREVPRSAETMRPAISPAPPESVRPTAAQPRRNEKTAVMEEYLQAMQRFLNVQQNIVEAFISRKSAQAPRGGGEDLSPATEENDRLLRDDPRSAGNPFSMTVSSLIPGQEVSGTCRLNMEEDIFLRDHTLGREVSTADPALTGLPVVPLTVSMEIMAQAASILVPEMKLVAMEEIRGHQWIVIEEGETRTLLLTAKHQIDKNPGKVTVQILSETGNDRLLVEGTMVFGSEFPFPPAVETAAFQSEGPFRFSRESFYREHLFLGPTFRTIDSVDRSGGNGAEAVLRVPPGVRMFRSDGDPDFFTDPVLLDGAGQVVGLWAQAHLETGFIAFPTGLDALHIYGPWPPPATAMKCRILPVLLPDGRMRTQIDVVGTGNRLLFRIVGWRNMRFFGWTREFLRFVLLSREFPLSAPWPGIVALFESDPGWYACRLLKPEEGIWLRMVEYLVLSRRERDAYSRLAGPPKRLREWLMGRAVAKDAVRLYLKDRHRVEVCPTDIEILADEHGRPFADGEVIRKIGCNPLLSIAHSGEAAVAVVGEGSRAAGVGIDVEQMTQTREGLEKIVLTSEEENLLSGAPASRKGEWLLRFWCAKEAVAKALGRGMGGGPWNLAVQKIEADSGKVWVKISGELARQLPDFADRVLSAATGREDDLVFAVSRIEEEGNG